MPTVSYTMVSALAPDTPVTSTQLAKIADACNDRARPNLGDWCERIVYGVFSFFRNLVAGDGTNFPPDAIFFIQAQNLLASTAPFPPSGAAPDDPGGVAIANPAGSYVFGNPVLESEVDRITLTPDGAPMLFIGFAAPVTLEDAWELGKVQRGAIDTATGLRAAPAIDRAAEDYVITGNYGSYYNNSWGGYMPAPVVVGECDRGGGVFAPSYEIIFTPIGPGSPDVFPGNCPTVSGNVEWMFNDVDAYVVKIVGETSIRIYPYEDWRQGPYTGSTIKKEPGEFLPRAKNAYTSDFRGTESEIATQTTWLQYAFDTQRFLLSQYFLEPARGTDDGDGGIDFTYPTGTIELAPAVTTIPAATVIDLDGGSTYAIHSGFVLGAVYIKTSKLISGTVEVYDVTAAAVVGTITLTPDGSGVGDTLTFENRLRTTIQLRAGTDCLFSDDTGYLTAEIAEILEGRPKLRDLFWFQRLASARSSPADGMDGSGLSESNSIDMGTSYFSTGAIINTHGAAGTAGSADDINSNALYDAARRLSQMVRIVPRAQLDSYEVTGGKSVLYFKRYVDVSGTDVDCFEGIAPAREAIANGDIEEGIVYVVRSGASIVYDEDTYAIGETFTGVAGETDYTSEGSPLVYEYEGIKAIAVPRGFTNEWLTGAFLKPYKEDEESIWKPSSYSDRWFWVERCNFYGSKLGSLGGLYSDLAYQYAYTSSDGPNWFAPEGMTGWRYSNGTNHWNCAEDDYYDDCIQTRQDRYKSCRIYEPLPEIESATVLIEGGIEIVKLVYKDRFHHHEDADASVVRDVSLWDITGFRTAEGSYRTMENGIREYLIQQYDGTDCQVGGVDESGHRVGMQGNAGVYQGASGNDPYGGLDAPKGSCYPDFYFLRLIRKPYDDGNNKQDDWDTPIWADWWREVELQIAFGCQGFVDGVTSTAVGCCGSEGITGCTGPDAGDGINRVYCYTLQSLCSDAFGGRWFNALAKVATSRITDAQIREDNPEGFGQLPNILLSSEIYNQFAAALNKLTRVQIMLPSKFEIRQYNAESSVDIEKTTPSEAECDNTANDTSPGYYRGTPPSPAISTPSGDWEESSAFTASVTSSVATDCADDGIKWKLRSTRESFEWRWTFADPDAVNALPEYWRDLVCDEDGHFTVSARVLACRKTITNTATVGHTDVIGDAASCGGTEHGYFLDQAATAAAGHPVYFTLTDTTLRCDRDCVVVSAAGKIEAPSVGASDFLIGGTTGGGGGGACNNAITNEVTFAPITGNDIAFIEVPLT